MGGTERGYSEAGGFIPFVKIFISFRFVVDSLFFCPLVCNYAFTKFPIAAFQTFPTGFAQ
jgi:hypothetical protein